MVKIEVLSAGAYIVGDIVYFADGGHGRVISVSPTIIPGLPKKRGRPAKEGALTSTERSRALRAKRKVAERKD